MTKITVKDTLLSYEEPLVILGEGPDKRKYIGINYDLSENGYKFYFCRVKPDSLKKLYAEKIDLHYVITKLHTGKYEVTEGLGQIGDILSTKKLDKLDPEMLPEPGLFIPKSRGITTGNERRIVDIDGRWGIGDLRKFSDLVEDCYGFGLALQGSFGAYSQSKVTELFQKYPWRGGFSSLNFFSELCTNIPIEKRAEVSKIQYASPGEIEFSMDGLVADSIRELILDINEPESEAQKTYKETHRWLEDKRWLSKSGIELFLDASDNDDLTKKLELMCEKFGLGEISKRVLELGQNDPLSAVKIILAYYRRLKQLADYVATGKAQNIFHT